ncbi:uncharacterized protein LY89DRAFT_778153 [Mollisia scopiformis]|uniref:Transmembrane protein n=1 Tax=Mollisia scopiformis TaxID=149040 RepID=A0A194XNT6_MOLSC|nr:uncharacterized protein LY89DRAFT_778153 [Mollisia scopiformis]KUJ21774.1 hypothetical protein LY89DRAFT_778153 [Mollisia scopiformis]
MSSFPSFYGHPYLESSPDGGDSKTYYIQQYSKEIQCNIDSEAVCATKKLGKTKDGPDRGIRIFSILASLASATAAAIIMGKYHPRPFETAESALRTEERRPSLWDFPRRHLEKLSQFRELDSMNPGGRETKMHRMGCTIAIETIKASNSKGSLAEASLMLVQSKLSPLVQRLQTNLSDPPPLLFLAACIVFSVAIGNLWESQKQNGYRAWIVGLGMMIGTIAALRTENILQEGKGILAMSAIVALAISSCVHSMMRIHMIRKRFKAMLAEHTVDGHIEGEKRLAAKAGMDEKQSDLATAPEKERTTTETVGN